MCVCVYVSPLFLLLTNKSESDKRDSRRVMSRFTIHIRLDCVTFVDEFWVEAHSSAIHHQSLFFFCCQLFEDWKEKKNGEKEGESRTHYDLIQLFRVTFLLCRRFGTRSGSRFFAREKSCVCMLVFMTRGTHKHKQELREITRSGPYVYYGCNSCLLSLTSRHIISAVGWN